MEGELGYTLKALAFFEEEQAYKLNRSGCHVLQAGLHIDSSGWHG
jgi:hypothetical protein